MKMRLGEIAGFLRHRNCFVLNTVTLLSISSRSIFVFFSIDTLFSCHETERLYLGHLPSNIFKLLWHYDYYL